MNVTKLCAKMTERCKAARKTVESSHVTWDVCEADGCSRSYANLFSASPSPAVRGSSVILALLIKEFSGSGFLLRVVRDVGCFTTDGCGKATKSPVEAARFLTYISGIHNI